MIYTLPIVAVILSFIFVYLLKPNKTGSFKLLLAFSGAFLLALTLFDLLPHVYHSLEPKIAGLFILLGILLQIFLEFFSKGAEHGHMHHSQLNPSFPWLLFISLSLHALLEGIPVETDSTILYGILVHKIPVAIILSFFFISSAIPLSKTILFILLFSFMTPIGTYLASNIPAIERFNGELTALVIGVFFHISTVILFEASEGHHFNLRKVLVILLAILIAFYI